jgi:hypothetical protein
MGHIEFARVLFGRVDPILKNTVNYSDDGLKTVPHKYFSRN